MSRSADDAGQLEAHREALRRQCLALTHNESEADDLVQDVLVAALTSSSFDPSRPMLPWLRGVARHKAVDRQRARRDPGPSSETLADAPRTEAATRAVRDGARAWMRLMSSLSSRARAVLLLRDLLDLDTQETADVLGLSVSNVKVVLHRARNTLAEGGAAPEVTTRKRVSAHLGDAPWEKSRWGLRAVVEAGAASHELGPELESSASWILWDALLHGLIDQVADDAALEVRLRLTRSVGVYPHRSYDPTADLDRALDLARGLGDAELLARVHVVRARRESRLGRLPAAMAELDQVGEGLSTELLVRTCQVRAGVLWRQGHFEAAREAYELARASTSDPLERSLCDQNLAILDTYVGQLDEALARSEEPLQTYLARGNLDFAARVQNTLGMALHNLGRLDEARDRFERGLELCARGGLPPRASLLNNLGLLEHEVGDFEAALARFDAYLRVGTQQGNERVRAIASANRGVTLRAVGRPHEAVASLERARALALEFGASHLAAFVCAHLAAAAAEAGAGEADRWTAEARTLLTDTPDPSMEVVVDVLEASARVRLGAPMTLAHAVLAAHGSPPPRSAAVRIALQVLADATS